MIAFSQFLVLISVSFTLGFQFRKILNIDSYFRSQTYPTFLQLKSPTEKSRFHFSDLQSQLQDVSIDKPVEISSLSKNYVKLLVELWSKISFPPDDDESSNENGLEFIINDYGLNRTTVKGLLNHFQSCRDCAADNAYLLASQDDLKRDILQLQLTNFNIFSDDEDDVFDEKEWGNFNEIDGLNTEDINTETIFPVEPKDDIVLKDMKGWISKVIADFAVCPFTVDAHRSGIPVGGVRYRISRAHTPEEAFLRYWEEVQLLLSTTEKEISTILLVFPELELFGNYELFESYCECLNDALCGSSMCLEDEIQLVFFHPKYQFRDGLARSGEEEGAANYARRSPWPMVNILRTPQVRAAQRGIPTGQVYKQNEERLRSIGVKKLQTMLYQRDWSELPLISSYAKMIREKDKIKDQNVVENESSDVTSSKCPVNNNTAPAPSHPVAAQTCPFTNKDTNPIVMHEGQDITTVNSPGSGLSDLISEQTDEMSMQDYLQLADEVEKWMETQE